MFEKISKYSFLVIFVGMIVIPLLTFNLQKDKVSEDENRKLAPAPVLYYEDGTLNKNYTSDFELWINDNIGFRSSMVIQNANIQFNVFGVLSNNSDMYLGPDGELNYATERIIIDYQHKNLYSEDKLNEIAFSFQTLNDYVVGKGAKFYYFQCWDKQSIYPEYFPKTIIQYGDTSKTDYFNSAICQQTNVNVISPKNDLIEAKEYYPTYSKWGDATHWTERGAYIGYQKLMNAINLDSEKQYRILQESDYRIVIDDQGETLFGGIHRAEDLEHFEILNPQATRTNDKLSLYSDDPRSRFFTNDFVDNDDRLLIIGDSYFSVYILDDLAESFHEVIYIHNDLLVDIQSVIDEYDADIVVVEAAERCDRTQELITGVKAIITKQDDLETN